ncbi:Dihydropteroate synthase [Ramaria rubella]|nr:Dihydropteroate synthase [Ramaria rubella]
MGSKDVVRVFDITVSESHRPDYPLLVLDPCPHRLTISFSVPHDPPPSRDDDEILSIDFGLMCDTLLQHSLRQEKFQGTEELADELCRIALMKFDAIDEIIVTVEKERYGEQRPRKLGLTARRTRDALSGEDTILVKGLEFHVMVGVHEWERMEQAVVTADLSLLCDPWRGGDGLDLPGLVASLHDDVKQSDDLTLESLAASISRTALSYGRGSQHPSRHATVKITKAKAIGCAEFVEVEVNRTAEYFTAPRQPPKAPVAAVKRPTHARVPSIGSAKGPAKHVVAIAIGSNIGDRYANIENALRQMEGRHEIITITGTSFLYESEPMYILDQDKFLNCVIMVETTLRPADLLILLKHLEEIVGRVKSLRNGPRAIDLDILFYDSLILDTRKDGGDGSKEGELVIPHMRLSEREFVLRPLIDLIPEYTHPLLKTTIRNLFKAHTSSQPSTLRKVIPFPCPPQQPQMRTILWPLSKKTYIMATINASPDSFSSSAANTPTSTVADAIVAASSGADIIDVGGYSTRPGATAVSTEEELKRVIPVIRRIREHTPLPISVDTFRPAVLRAAVEAGANCLNDVTALTGDGTGKPGEMALAARELGVPVVMMHSRGAHSAGENKEYGERGVLDGVQHELGKSVQHALRCGLRRWNLIVDPGFGFSKTTDGNLELLRRLGELTASPVERRAPNPLEGFPTLVGLGRKSFLGKLVRRETEPLERDWATAAAVTAAVQQGADVARVHNVAEIRDVLQIADAVWRGVSS